MSTDRMFPGIAIFGETDAVYDGVEPEEDPL
jgi:hypothetical protein